MPMNIYFIRKRNGSRKELGRHPFTFDKARSEEGRVKFASRYGENHDTPERALQVMLQAFADGLVRIFVDGEEVTDLDAALSLKEGSEVVFLRLTFLSGLLW